MVFSPIFYYWKLIAILKSRGETIFSKKLRSLEEYFMQLDFRTKPLVYSNFCGICPSVMGIRTDFWKFRFLCTFCIFDYIRQWNHHQYDIRDWYFSHKSYDPFDPKNICFQTSNPMLNSNLIGLQLCPKERLQIQKKICFRMENSAPWATMLPMVQRFFTFH